MNKVRDVIAYYVQHYPHKEELSKAKLTKMVYLADWKSAIRYEKQITDIEWVFNHYGPYVEDIIQLARNSPDFHVEETENIYGSFKEIIRAYGILDYQSLTREEQRILDFVIEVTAPKNWSKFIKLVYSTYPIVTQSRHSKLNLVNLAKEYQKNSHLF